MTTDVDLSTIAARCRFRREQLGLSQEKLAALAGYSGQSGISGIEDGRVRKPSNLLGLAQALGVRPEWLLIGDDPMIYGDFAARTRNEPVPAPEVPPPARFAQWDSRPGYQMVEIRREMPTAFAIRVLDLMLELDRAEAEAKEKKNGA